MHASSFGGSIIRRAASPSCSIAVFIPTFPVLASPILAAVVLLRSNMRTEIALYHFVEDDDYWEMPRTYGRTDGRTYGRSTAFYYRGLGDTRCFATQSSSHKAPPSSLWFTSLPITIIITTMQHHTAVLKRYRRAVNNQAVLSSWSVIVVLLRHCSIIIIPPSTSVPYYALLWSYKRSRSFASEQHASKFAQFCRGWWWFDKWLLQLFHDKQCETLPADCKCTWHSKFSLVIGELPRN